MALVAYSDSEGSDTESPAPAPVAVPKSAAKSSLSSFLPPPSKKRKLVDDNAPASTATAAGSTGARKIKVDLPKISADVEDDDSTSRRKIGKSGGGGSSMLSFLPAPKRTGVEAAKVAQASVEEEKKQKVPTIREASAGHTSAPPRTLGGGMKRAEYAGTTMDMRPTVEDEPESITEPSGGETLTSPAVAAAALSATPKGPVQGRAIQPFFRKSTSKKKATSNGVSTTAATKIEEKKVSLFSLGSALNDRLPETTTVSTSGDYKPLLVEDSAPDVVDIPQAQDATYEQTAYAETPHTTTNTTGGPTFQSISEEVGMDEASMRMFMGRRGRNQEIKVANFNVDQEYEKNEKARAAGELAPEKTVVRSIKPGKHNLSSLVNAAQNQRTALEESFAEGRRNKKEAGNKYGW